MYTRTAALSVLRWTNIGKRMIGKCLCGQIVFRVSGTLPYFYQCHCGLCKKATGAAASTGFVVGVDKLEWITGKSKISSYTTEKGFRSDFCNNCGSPVPNKMNVGEYIWIPAGTLEGSVESRIGAHIFTENRGSWELDTSNCLVLKNGPDNIDEFMHSLIRE